MAILKLVRDSYRNTDAIDNLTKYLLNKDKMPNMCFGGTGVMLSDPATSMNMTKKLLGQTHGKQLEHFILAFDDVEGFGLTADIDRTTMFAYEICAFFSGAQTLFALHEIKNTYQYYSDRNHNLHFHFIVNTINPYDNKRVWINYTNEFELQKYITHLLIKYNISTGVRIVTY